MATNPLDTSTTSFEHLLPASWKKICQEWLVEDTPSFDYGGFVVGDSIQTAFLYQKTKGVLAGVPFFNQVFKECDCTVEWKFKEGEFISMNQEEKVVVAVVKGKARNLLLGERPALNMIARASGIASRCRRLKEIKENQKWDGTIAGTRKTTPGFRLVEKYSMLVGGIDTHRMDLSSMIMLKDNHIWATGSITQAVRKAKSVGGFALKVEVECRTIEEAMEAIESGADIIMLDNFKGNDLVEASRFLKNKYSVNVDNTQTFLKSFLIEASGGLTEENCSDYFCPDVDILSFGSVSQSVSHIDFSLKVQAKK